MQLQRRRRSLAVALLVVAFGLVGLVCAWGAVNLPSRIFYAAGGVLAVALGVATARDELRPFRFGIGPDGITTREGLQAWPSIERVVLDEPVPPAASGAHLVLQPGDRVVLKLDDVKQTREQIVEALRVYGGDRLDDRIARRGHRPDFALVLRGYETVRINRLLRRAADARLSGDPDELAAARAALLEPDLLVVPRGYDRAQVEAHLRKLAARLTG